MANPQFISEEPVSLIEVKHLLEQAQKRDTQLSFVGEKTKNYVEQFVSLSSTQKEELQKKLAGLELARLKPEHVCKIIDFLPQSLQDLKVTLAAYPLTFPKKDQESIVEAVKSVVSG